MDTDEDESCIAELMDAVLNIQSRESEGLGIVFRYLPVDSLKVCRVLNKTLHEAATKCLLSRSIVRINNASIFQRYLHEFPAMQTVWENYSISINNRLSADLLLQFGSWCGHQVKTLDIDVKFRDTNLTYLEDLISEKLPNLQEFTIRGKFPSTARFMNPERMIGKMGKVEVFNLFAANWHRLPPLPNGEVAFRNPVIGQLLAAMPNTSVINYFPDVDSPREAHRHYSSFLVNLTENDNVILGKLKEIKNFTFSFISVQCMEMFAKKRFPLEKLHILVEEEVQPEALYFFLETFRATLSKLVIRSATGNPFKWPRLLRLEELTLVGVNVYGTDFLASFPSLKQLKISQDRVTAVDFTPDRCLQIPHTLTSLHLIETFAVNVAERLSDNGLAIIFRDLPYLNELVIIQKMDSSKPTFSDEGFTGSKMSISKAELSVWPRDLRVINRNMMRYNHFIGSLSELRKLTLKAPTITDISLLCGIVNCHKLTHLNISSPQISEKACIEFMDYIQVSHLRIQDFGGFTSSGKAEILVRMKFQEVFHSHAQ